MTSCGDCSASRPASRSTRRRSAASRSSSSGRTRGGTRPTRRWAQGPEADPARPGQPARDALDGPLVAGRRHPRHAEPGLDRLLGLARLHPDVHPARPSGCSTHVDIGTTSSSSRHSPWPRAEARCRRVASRLVAGLLVLLVWKVVARATQRASPARHEGRACRRRRDFTLAARTATGKLSLASLAARSWSSTSGPPGASRARAEAPRSRRRGERYREPASSFVGVDAHGLLRRRAQVPRAHGVTYPNVRDPTSVLGKYGGLPIPRTFVSADWQVRLHLRRGARQESTARSRTRSRMRRASRRVLARRSARPRERGSPDVARVQRSSTCADCRRARRASSVSWTRGDPSSR